MGFNCKNCLIFLIYDISGYGNQPENVQPECPAPGLGMDNINTFVNCGMGVKFVKDGTYEIQLKICTEVGCYVYIKTLEVEGTIRWEESLNNLFNNGMNGFAPWQGLNVTIDDEDFHYRKQDFIDFDLDKRPGLGCFFYSDDPNNYINPNGNLSDVCGPWSNECGYYINYYQEDKCMSGIKWGGPNGIGKKYSGSIKNIEKE